MTDINQIAFDKVARHLLTQGKRSVNDKGECRYRAPDGCKCAIGALIDDEHYQENFEGWGVQRDPVFAAVEASLGGDPDIALLRLLQGVHDKYHPGEWSDGLHEIAEEFDLSTAVLDEF